jgi:CSLREA domain-containing protein
MPHSFRSFKFWICVAALALVSLACNIGFVRDIAGRIDTTPTDCNAEVFVVTAPSDTHDGMCNTHCTLRDAVFAANTCPGEDIIQLGAGTFSLNLRGTGSERGDLDITESVTITGISPENTLITAAESWRERIFEIAAGATVQISGLTISNGDTETEAGGGILNFGSLTLENVSLRQNAAYSGGALYNAGAAQLQNVRISDNSVLASFDVGRGGFILPFPDGGSPDGCGGGIANAGNMQISGATVSGNASRVGAGICNLNGGVMTVAGSQVSENGSRATALGGGFANFGALSASASQINDNVAGYGGGMYILMPSGTALDLQQVTIEGNRAVDDHYSGKGGGLFIKSGTFNIDNSLILANRAEDWGGGIHFEPGSGGIGGGATELGDTYRNAEGVITRTTIANNRAEKGDGRGKGGGISSNGSWGNGRYHFENVTISGNQAYERGGAINTYRGGDFTFVNVTIAHNWGRTTSGINVESFAAFRFKSTLIVGNSPWNCDFAGGPNIISQGYNIEAGNLCGLRGRTDIQLSPGALLIFPELVEDNGQLVHILNPGSTAVDRIPTAECLAADQRGTSRPQGEWCDIGAYELEMVASSLQGFSTPLLPEATPTSTALPTPTDAPQIPEITFTRNAFCRKGPGTAYFDVTAFESGKIADIVGKNQQGSWWLVQIPGGQERCWVADSVGDKTGDLSLLPVEPAPVLPDAPTGFNDSSICSPNLNARDVKLAWKDSPNETGYRLYRNGVLLATLGANVGVYVDNTAKDKGFTYEIEAINAFGASARQTTEVSACD